MKTVLHVAGMSCSHCVTAVTKAVGALAGVSQVTVDLETKTVAVVYDEDIIGLAAIQAEIEELGYDIV